MAMCNLDTSSVSQVSKRATYSVIVCFSKMYRTSSVVRYEKIRKRILDVTSFKYMHDQ